MIKSKEQIICEYFRMCFSDANPLLDLQTAQKILERYPIEKVFDTIASIRDEIYLKNPCKRLEDDLLGIKTGYYDSNE